MAGFWTSSPPETRYQRLVYYDSDDTERGSSPSPHRSPRRHYQIPSRLGGWSIKTCLAFSLSMVLLMLLAVASTHEELTLKYAEALPPLPTELPSLSPLSNSDPRQLKLKIILPADDPNNNLCKTIFSAVANGYPSPNIVNWGREFNKGEDPDFDAGTSHEFGTSHLGKIDGTLRMLDSLVSDDAPPGERITDDDLILVLDAYDVWFQLPPSVLIERFHAQNAQSEARLRRSFSGGSNLTTGGAPVGVPPPRQDIIISAQKKCWPTRKYGNAMRCDAMPPSPARPDLYGPWTDQGSLHDRRPRHVNSGSIMGTAGAMRRMFRAVQKKVDAGQVAVGSDQGVFAHVMAEQELWRREAEAWNERLALGQIDEWVDAEAETARLTAQGRELDHGIGLDWVQDMFQPTVFAENDGDFMYLNDTSAVHIASIAHDVFPVRIHGVPDDMRSLPGPLEMAGLLSDERGSPVSPNWNEVPLYTDYWSANVPVMVHHNAHKHGMKPLRLSGWWDRTWFFPYLRDIVRLRAAEDSSGQSQPQKLASVPSRQGVDLTYWPSSADSSLLPKVFMSGRMTKKATLDEASWSELCPQNGRGDDDWIEEIFRDGGGAL